MKKALRIIKNIFTGLMVVLAIVMMLFTMVSTIFGSTDKSILGYKAYIVLSDSMSKTDFDAGDLIIVKEVDSSTLQEGDIIAYISQNSESYGEVITHKIRSLTTDNNEPGFITYGTTTDTNDSTIVTYPYVLGKYSFHIPKLGTFFNYLKTTPGYITCILIPFLTLIIIEIINSIRLFNKYKLEQRKEIEKEKRAIEKQKQETMAMLKQLQDLKEQLNKSNTNTVN
jgi:signal peptidase I